MTGTCCGFAAVLLHWLIRLVRSIPAGAASGGASQVLLLLFPGLGMLVSLLLLRYLIKDDIGHGVTKVLVAVSKNESRIRSHNTWSSMLTSAITIGSGGSVGAEAPIVYTGAAIGSNLARLAGLPYRSATVLIGCGAAGAIAGIFKAPLAAVLFTLEILLFNISMTSMIPLLVSTVSATLVSYVLLGDSRPFECVLSPFSMGNMPWYLALGIFCGFAALYFMRSTLWLEDRLSAVRKPLLKWLLCASGLGILIFLFPPLYGEGYDFLHPLLSGGDISYEGPLSSLFTRPAFVPLFFLLVMLLKVFAMTFTNAGGGVGGTFGPTLFVGAIAGFVLARTLNLLFGMSLPEQNFVLVGMAGLMAGAMQAPMTAIFLIAEITGGYELFLPLLLTSTVAFATMRVFERYSIYTKRIARSGELLTHDSDKAVLTLLKVSDLVETDFTPVPIDATLGQFVKVISTSSRNLFPVVDGKGHFQGYVSLDDVKGDMFNPGCYDDRHVFNYMQTAPEYVYPEDAMSEVMGKFDSSGAWNLPVVARDRTYLGFVSKSKIFSSYRSELRELSQD